MCMCVCVCVCVCVCECTCVMADQGEQVEEEAGVLADHVVRLRAQIHKQLETAGWPLTTIDHVRHVRGQDKGGAVSKEGKGGFRYT